MNDSSRISLQQFKEGVVTKFQLYNSLFTALPFHRIEKTGILLSLLLVNPPPGYVPPEINDDHDAKPHVTPSYPELPTAQVVRSPQFWKLWFLYFVGAGAGLMVFAINANGQVIGFPVPLSGFKTALDGPPADEHRQHDPGQPLHQRAGPAPGGAGQLIHGNSVRSGAPRKRTRRTRQPSSVRTQSWCSR